MDAAGSIADPHGSADALVAYATRATRTGLRGLRLDSTNSDYTFAPHAPPPFVAEHTFAVY